MNQYNFFLRNILDRIKRFGRDPKIIEFYWQTYVLSRFEKAHPDITIVSHLKCGRTWVRVMFLKYLELLNSEHNRLPFHDKSILQFDDGLKVKFDHEQSDIFPLPKKASQLVFNTAKYSQRKIIFLARDPRDVVVSYWYMLKFVSKTYQGNLSEFIRDELFGIHKIIAFFNLWISHSQNCRDFHLITYEALSSNAYLAFNSLFEFMGVDIHDETLRFAIQETQFDKMKIMEKEKKFDEPWMRSGTGHRDDAMKVRKGKVGGYRDDLTRADARYVNEAIRNHCSPLLPYSNLE